MAIKNSSVVLPVQYTTEVIKGVLGASKALALGRRLPDMTGLQTKLNVLSNLPVAGWTKNSALPAAETTSEIKVKPLSTLAWQGKDLYAEEIAVIIPVAENTFDDVNDGGVAIAQTLNEQVIGAFQDVIDSTVFFGVNAPWAGFTGVVAEATAAGKVVAWDGLEGTSFYSAVNQAMKKVEKSGFVPNAILGGPSLESAFRGSITTLGVISAEQGQIGALPRHIDLTGGFDQSEAFAIVGDFRYLVYAFRKEMKLTILREATLTDPTSGAVLYNLAQQDMIGFRFSMRLGVALPNPVNRVGGANGYPFAVITSDTETSE